MKKTTAICAAITAAALLGACRNGSDEPGPVPGEETAVTLRFLWPDSLVTPPAAMSVVFFPADDAGMVWRFTLPDTGATVAIPAGRYSVMSYSADMSDIRVRFDDTPASAVAALAGETDSVARSASTMMWGANTPALDFGEPPAANRLTLVATPVTARYRIRVGVIADSTRAPLGFVPAAPSASLGGMAASLGMFSGNPEEAAGVTVETALSPSRQGAALTGRLISLGPQNPGPREQNMLCVSFFDPSGRRWKGHTDVGPQIAAAPYPKSLTILVDTLIARPEGTPPPSIDPIGGVDDWNTVIIDIGR